jgi:hypothetical protein
MQATHAAVALAELASGQWGLLTTPQAEHVGVSRVQLSRLTQAGLLHRLSHGIYALRGAETSEHLEVRAAWLALDPTRMASDRLKDGPTGAVASHTSAADLYGFGDLDADHHEFIVPARKQTRRPDLRLHLGSLRDDEITLIDGLPVTKPARIVIDLLTTGHDGEHVAGVLAGAIRARAIDVSQLAPCLAPFAARLGFAAHDWQGLLDHLLELGGVADQVFADKLVEAAQASNNSLAEWLNSSVTSQLSQQLASTPSHQREKTGE